MPGIICPGFFDKYRDMLFKLKLIIQGWTNWLIDKISDIKYKNEFDARMEICNACDDNMSGVCKHCGCVLAAKTKAEESECPIGKWKTIKETINEKTKA